MIREMRRDMISNKELVEKLNDEFKRIHLSLSEDEVAAWVSEGASVNDMRTNIIKQHARKLDRILDIVATSKQQDRVVLMFCTDGLIIEMADLTVDIPYCDLAVNCLYLQSGFGLELNFDKGSCFCLFQCSHASLIMRLWSEYPVKVNILTEADFPDTPTRQYRNTEVYTVLCVMQRYLTDNKLVPKPCLVCKPGYKTNEQILSEALSSGSGTREPTDIRHVMACLLKRSGDVTLDIDLTCEVSFNVTDVTDLYCGRIGDHYYVVLEHANKLYQITLTEQEKYLIICGYLLLAGLVNDMDVEPCTSPKYPNALVELEEPSNV